MLPINEINGPVAVFSTVGHIETCRSSYAYIGLRAITNGEPIPVRMTVTVFCREVLSWLTVYQRLLTCVAR